MRGGLRLQSLDSSETVWFACLVVEELVARLLNGLRRCSSLHITC